MPIRKAVHRTWTKTFRVTLILQLMRHASPHPQVGVATVALLTVTSSQSFIHAIIANDMQQMICRLPCDLSPVIFTDPSNNSRYIGH
jgi:hypothetical protein